MFARFIDARSSAPAPALLLVAVLALLCLWLAARLVGSLLASTDADPVIASDGVIAAAPAPAATVAGWHLFGNALPVHDPRQAAAAPETDLDLVLVGVLALADPAAGIALIADAGGNEQAYRVGAELPGGSRLRGVHADHVRLDRGGREESLSLRRADPGVGPATAPMSSSSPSTASAGAMPGAPSIPGAQAVDWQAVQRQIEVDPLALARSVRVLPVIENGSIVGMRLGGGAQSPLVARLGLGPDDIVTAVNGISVRDVGRAQQILASVRDADRVSVTVRRNGQEQTLNVDLK